MKKILLAALFLLCFQRFELNAQNTDFELSTSGTYTSASAVAEWLVSSQTATSCNASNLWLPGSPEFSIVSTPILNVPFIGNLPNSPLGGTKVAQLNSMNANSSVTKITHTLAINSGNTLFAYAFAGIWQSGTHNCCEQPAFKIELRNPAGGLVGCQVHTLVVPACNASSPQAAFSTFTNTAGTYWSSWQSGYMDLSSQIGTTVTIEVTSSDCTLGDHSATLFFDASSPSVLFADFPFMIGPDPFQVNFCGGSNAFIQGPLGYLTYSWTAPSAYPISPSQATLSSLTLTNAAVSSIYTLTVMDAAGCIYWAADTLAYKPVNIAGLGSSPSCSMGASGSATVLGAGSGTGYTYTWTNASSSVVSTSSVASNLPGGNYTVVVNAAGSQSSSCGTASSAITVSTNVGGVINILKPYCSGSAFAYLSMPGGSNYQWYNNITSISGATNSAYTVSSPCNGCNYRLRYTSPQGCLDSLNFVLASVSSGSLAVYFSGPVCQGAQNGSAIFTISGNPTGMSYTVGSVGSTPAYSVIATPTSGPTYTATNLSGGSTYSVQAFNGSCFYSTTFSVPAIAFDFTPSPAASPTICSGNSALVSVNFANTPAPGQYTYSWSPSTFLFGTNAQMTPFTPTVAPGSVTTIVYTVIVTPTLANCPVTKTLEISAASPIAPTISPVPSLCGNSPGFTLSANPAGGVFHGNNAVTSAGILSPSLAVTGANAVMYTSSLGNCSLSAATVFTIHQVPLLSVSGNTSVCDGNTVTLYAMGADSFTWNGSQSGSVFSSTPVTNSIYTVSGTNTVTACSNSKTLAVIILPNPNITVIGDTALCAGESTTLTGGGGSNYTWLSGSTFLSQDSLILTPNVQTTYTLYGTGSNGCSNSKAVTISVSGCTGLAESRLSEGIVRFYPNPFQEKISIETSRSVKIVVQDAMGRAVLDQKLEAGIHSIDLASLADGIYFLRTTSANGTGTVKLVKKN